jgi:hypothetical protein
VAGVEPDRITLIEGVKKVRGAPQVEHPDEREPQPALEPGQGQQSEQGSNKIAVGGGAGPGGRQLGRHDTGHQERQADEAESVETKKRPQGLGARPASQLRPEIGRRHNAPGDEAESNAGPEQFQ